MTWRKTRTRGERLRCSLIHWRCHRYKLIGGHVGYSSVVRVRCLRFRAEWVEFIP